MRLPQRAVLSVSGSDAQTYLQGLTTNDMRSLEGPKDAMYTTFLNHKGRVIADALVSLSPAQDTTFFVDCALSQASRLHKHLRMYRLRAQVSVEDLRGSHEVMWAEQGEATDAMSAVAREQWGNMCAASYPDPRLDGGGLGTRAIVQPHTHTAVPRTGAESDAADGTEIYEQRRVQHGIAEGEEMHGGVPLEYNIEWIHGVHFGKGCYLGQELTARTHFRGVVRKRCMPVQLLAQEEAAAAVPVSGSRRSNVAGKLLAIAPGGEWGLAMVRLKHLARADASETSSGAWNPLLVSDASESKDAAPLLVRPVVPSWWQWQDSSGES